MKMFECIVVDDEPLAIKILAKFIEKHPQLTLKKAFTKSFEAQAYLLANSYDILLLDIHMPVKSGLDLLKTLDKTVPCILTTAYRDYAVEGFELNVVDYLMKPIRYERFCKAIDRIIATPSANNEAQSIDSDYVLVVKMNRKNYRISTKSIYYLESNRNNVIIYTDSKDYKCVSTLKHMLSELPDEFIQIHRSFVVNKAYVRSFTKQEVVISNNKIPVGEKYVHQLNNLK